MKGLLSLFLVLNCLVFSMQSSFAQETKSKKFFRNVGRGLGDGLATGAKYSMVPFLASTSFLSGFFQAEELRAITRLDKRLAEGKISAEKYAKKIKKFKDRIASILVLEVLMDDQNIVKLEAIHKEAMESGDYLTVEDYIEKVTVVVSDALIEYGEHLANEFIIELISDLISKREVRVENVSSFVIDGKLALSKLTLDEQLALLEYGANPSLLRKFKSFRNFERLSGPLSNDQIRGFFTGLEHSMQGLIDDRAQEIWDAQKTGIIVEFSSAIVTEVLTSSFVLSLIPSISFGVASIPVLAMNVGAGIMVWQCMTGTDLKNKDNGIEPLKEEGEVVKLTTRKKIEIYQQLKAREADLTAEELELMKNYGQLAKICNKALNHGLLKLFKVRSKGYLVGKKSKVRFNIMVDNIKTKIKKMNEKRKIKRAKRLKKKSLRSNKENRENFFHHKFNTLPN